MRPLKWSRDFCALIAFTTLIGAPAFANNSIEDMVPLFCATMVSSAVGFIVFDRAFIKARREAESRD